MDRTSRPLALLGAALLLVSSATVALGQEGDASLEGIEWRLTSYSSEDGLTPVPETVDATLLLESGTVRGSGGCNSFSGSYSLDGGTLTMDEGLARTLMLCEGDARIVEEPYLDALTTVAGWTREAGTLRLQDESGADVLVFEAIDGPPVSGADDTDPERIAAAIAALQADVADLQARIAALEAAAEREPRTGDEP